MDEITQDWQNKIVLWERLWKLINNTYIKDTDKAHVLGLIEDKLKELRFNLELHNNQLTLKGLNDDK